MSDEEKKERYANIVYRLNVIKNKTDNLCENIYDLENKMKSSILIDDDIPESAKIDSSYNNANATRNTIRYSIIPSLESKIYS